MDSETIVSGITNDSNEEIDTTTWDNIISEKKEVLLKSLQKYGIEILKNKCKESKINTKFNKKETMIDDILIRFEKNSQSLQKMLKSDIRKIAKLLKLKINGKKDIIIFTILDHHIDHLIFTLEEEIEKVIETEDIPKDILKINSLESEKQKMLDKLKEIENEMEKQRIEEEKRLEELKLEELKRLEEEKSEELKKKEEKKKKQQIPKQIRSIIWNLYIGDDMIKHKCLCCKKVTITNTSFEVGHVISEHDGGTLEVNNLRPICSACNKSMGTMNMRDYVLKYGLLI